MARTALDGSRVDSFRMLPEDLVIVGLDTPDGPEHPLYDERVKLPIDEKHVRNVLQMGVLEPILVRKDGEKAQVVDGRQRVRWAREANQILVAGGQEPMRVIVLSPLKVPDKDVIGVMVSANEIRSMDEAKVKAEKAKRLVEKYKYSEKEAATAFGVSENTVKSWLALDNLAPEVVAEVESGTMAPTAAVQLAAMPRQEQVEELKALKERTAGRKITVADAAAAKRTRAAKESGEKVTVRKAPGKRVFNKILAHPDVEKLPEGAVPVLKWVLGLGGADRVRGLSAILRDIMGEFGEEAK